jgi:hypothetical protein
VLRFPKAPGAAPSPAPIAPKVLLQSRRAADRGADLWSAFDVIQENVIRSGQRGQVVAANGFRRRASVREVTGINQSRALKHWDNRGSESPCADGSLALKEVAVPR